MAQGSTNKTRVTVDFTPRAFEELERVKEMTGLSTSDVVRYGFALFRMYVQAKSENKEVRIIDPRDPKDQTLIALPIDVDPRMGRRSYDERESVAANP